MVYFFNFYFFLKPYTATTYWAQLNGDGGESTATTTTSTAATAVSTNSTRAIAAAHNLAAAQDASSNGDNGSKNKIIAGNMAGKVAANLLTF